MTHLAIVGPTASGKSALAFALARLHPEVELVSIDSMQVYRGMDIGTAKPSRAERTEVPHHLIDVADPGERFTAARVVPLARRVLDKIDARGHVAVLVGGTGLYLQAVIGDLAPPGEFPAARDEVAGLSVDELARRLRELDPLAASRIEPGNVRRLRRALEVTVGSGRPFSSFGPGVGAYPPQRRFRLTGVWLPRAVLARRITERVRTMVADGLVSEVGGLSDVMGATARQALGYKEILEHLEHGRPLEECIADIERRTREFSRRQRAWFRRDPRIAWYGTASDPGRLLGALDRELGRCMTGPRSA